MCCFWALRFGSICKRVSVQLACVVAACLVGRDLPAQTTYTFTGTSSPVNWSDPTQWDSNGVGGGVGSIVNLTPNAIGQTITLDIPESVGTLNIGSQNDSMVFADGGAVLTFDNSGSTAMLNDLNGTGGQVFINPSISLNGNLLINNATAYNVLINSNISGSASMTVSTSATGGGTIILAGNQANFFGRVSVLAGSLQLGGPSAIGPGNAVFVSSAGTFDLASSPGVTTAGLNDGVGGGGYVTSSGGGGPLTLGGSGQYSFSGQLDTYSISALNIALAPSGTQTFAGSTSTGTLLNLNVNSGTFQLSNSAATVGITNLAINGATVLFSNAALATVTTTVGNLTFGSGTMQVSSPALVNMAGTGTYVFGNVNSTAPAVYVQTGGSANIAGSLALGESGAVGDVLSISGGTLSVGGNASIYLATNTSQNTVATTVATMNVSGGLLDFTDNGSSNLKLAGGAASTAIVNISGGTIAKLSNNTFYQYYGANNGSVYINQTGGLYLTGGTGNAGNVDIGQGATTWNGTSQVDWTVSGGTLIHNSTNNFLVGGDSNVNAEPLHGAQATLTVMGSALLSTPSSLANVVPIIVGAGFTLGTPPDTLNIAGGTVSLNGTSNNLTVGEFGVGTVNLGGNGLLALGGSGIGSAAQGLGSGQLNLGGGTIQMNGSNKNFISGLNAGAYVYPGGTTINMQATSGTIAQALLAASGSGVSSIAVTGSGSGYTYAPSVTFAGGTLSPTGGYPAQGIATVVNGQVTGITVTNPGSYSILPNAVLISGGGGSNATASFTSSSNAGGGVQKVGSGALTLTGANTYSGNTVIGSGTLVVTSGGSLSVTLTPTGLMTPLTFNMGDGTIALNNASNMILPNWAMNGYGVNEAGSSLTQFAVGPTVNSNFFSLAKLNTPGTSETAQTPSSGMYAIGTPNLYIASSTAGMASGELMTGGTLSGGTSAQIMSVSGGTVELNLYNTSQSYTSPSTVTFGAWQSLPSTGAVIIGSPGQSATLDLKGSSQVISDLQIGAGATASSQRVTNSSGTAASLTIANNANNYAGGFAGDIANGAGSVQFALNLTGTGNPSFTLSGSNAYSGGTSISNGVLKLGSSNALGTGGLIANGGTLNMEGYNVTVNSFSGALGTITNSGTDNTVFTISQSATTSFGGSINNGPTNKTALELNNGTLVLSGNNGYTGGTVVEGGTLVLAAADSIASGSSLSVGSNLTAFAPVAASSPAGIAAVPEPGTAALLLIAAVGGACIVRRRRGARADIP
jgi:fibronectin-binding autotransporter adhesin